jgi:hypothetical protein
MPKAETSTSRVITPALLRFSGVAVAVNEDVGLPEGH